MVTLQFIPYNEIAHLPSDKRISKVLSGVKDNKIVLLEGRLKKHEETALIAKTMEAINDDFSGIEVSVVYPDAKKEPWYGKVKRTALSLLLGNRLGFTVIGPASVVKEIKRNPDKIELYTTDKRKK